MRKHLITFLVLFIIICVKSYSQPYGWFTQTSGTISNLNNVYFANSNTGIAVGQQGVVLRTTNGGTNWTSIVSGTPNHLFGVFFVNSTTGFIVGDVGLILKSTNGGVGWSALNSGVNVQLQSISFRDVNTGYVVGWYGTFLRTTNGGSNWQKYSTTINTNLICVSFADANVGFAVGQYGKLVRTSNAGVNWAEISTGTSALLEHVTFLNATTGTIIGENGIIRKTVNAGVNWTNQTSGTGSWLNGMSFQNSAFHVVVGEDGLVRKTSDGGANWYSQVSNTGNWLRKTNFIDTNIGWAVGDNGTIIKTTTGGWLLPGAATLSAPANNATCFSLTGTLDWSDVFPPISNYRVQIATDQNFTNIVHNQPGINVSTYAIPANALQFNTQYYWRVRATNQVGESTSWSAVRNFRTTTQAPSAPNLNLPANNSSVNTTPQLRWDSIPVASSYRCRVATDTGFTNVVLDSNNIANRYINIPAGKLLPNTRYYWRVTASNSCITSPNSVRWSFVTDIITGISQTGSEIPSVYELYTNYPNPFNPVTSIKFDLPAGSNVKITVFDMLGSEVTRLVNNNLAAGRYSVDWDASAYGSGVYFYRVEAFETGGLAREFVKVKKMVLVK
jgi:photosystem II stability/assembly factor-like uncharacterized protein